MVLLEKALTHVETYSSIIDSNGVNFEKNQ